MNIPPPPEPDPTPSMPDPGIPAERGKPVAPDEHTRSYTSRFWRVEHQGPTCALPKADSRRWRNRVYVCECGQGWVSVKAGSKVRSDTWGAVYQWHKITLEVTP